MARRSSRTSNRPPVITSQPASQTNNGGTGRHLNRPGRGQLSADYQWRLNGTNISRRTTKSYTRTNVQPAEAGGYALFVTIRRKRDQRGGPLTVYFLAADHTSPRTEQYSGAMFYHSCRLSQSGPDLQWRLNGTNISGASASAYTRTNAQIADAGAYSVVVSEHRRLCASSNPLWS